MLLRLSHRLLPSPPVERRIFGIENEYGSHLHAAGPAPAQSRRGGPISVPPGGELGPVLERFPGERSPSLPRRGEPPEYATPECDSLHDLVAHDKAGERILEGLVRSAEQRLEEEGSAVRSTSSRTTPTRRGTHTGATRTTW